MNKPEKPSPMAPKTMDEASLKEFNVLVTDRFEADALTALKQNQALSITQSIGPNPTASELKNTQGLVIRSRTKITAKLLDLAPKLQVIITSTSGFDHIDLAETAKREIKVMYTPSANAASACELTWGLVLACARKLIDAHSAVKNGEWRREALLGVQLRGKTYGVIGLGRIGTRVMKVAQAFGMQLIAYDPYKDDEHFQKFGVKRVSLEEVFKLSDVISVHVPAAKETQGLVTRSLLKSANRDLILVNSSRGTVATEEDLVEALNQKWIGSLGLDVFESEPLPQNSAVLAFKNVALTPHIGATTHEAFKEASWEAAAKLQDFAASGIVSDSLPPSDPWWR